MRALLLLCCLLAAPALAQAEEAFPVKYADIGMVQAVLERLMPDVHYEVDSNLLKCAGSPASLERVRGWVTALDQPSESVMVDLRLICGQEAWTGNDTVRCPFDQSDRCFEVAEFKPAQLQRMIADNEAKVLASPRVSTQWDQPVRIFVPDELRMCRNVGLTVSLVPDRSENGRISCNVTLSNNIPGETSQGSFTRSVRDGDTLLITDVLSDALLRAWRQRSQAKPMSRIYSERSLDNMQKPALLLTVRVQSGWMLRNVLEVK